MQNSKIEIYTDGSCIGNPGPGGWAAMILHDGGEHTVRARSGDEACASGTAETTQAYKKISKISGGEKDTTNNRMEMMAMIKALEFLHKKIKPTLGTLNSAEIILYSDSNLLIQTLNLGWKRKANTDLWAEIDRLRAWLNIKWIWVKAHHSNKYNNMVDEVAFKEAEKQSRQSTRED